MAHRVLNINTTLDMTAPSYTPIFEIHAGFELSLTGTWTGTVSVLRRASAMDDWGIANSYTENIEDSAVFQGNTVSQYMIAVTSAGTGSCKVRAYK